MDHLVRLEILGPPEQLDRQVSMVQRVLPVLRARAVHPGKLDLEVHQDQTDREVLQEIQVELAIRVLPVHRDLKGSVVQLAPVDLSGILDSLELRVELDSLVQ